MKNTQNAPFNCHPEQSERKEKPTRSSTAKRPTPTERRDQATLDSLMKAGFVWEEAIMLIHLREHLYENSEMRQRMTDDLRMHFARWLYEHNEMNEGLEESLMF